MDAGIVQNCVMLTMMLEGVSTHLTGDRGAETMYGIASRYVPHAERNIKLKVISGKLTLQEAIDYYKKYYVDPRFRNAQTPGVFFLLYDNKVHGTRGGGIIILQWGLNKIGKKVKIDAVMGNETIAAMTSLTPSEYEKFWNATFTPEAIVQAGAYLYSAQKYSAYKSGGVKKLGWGVNGMINRIVSRAIVSRPGFIEKVGKISTNPSQFNSTKSSILKTVEHDNLFINTQKEERSAHLDHLSSSKNGLMGASEIASEIATHKSWFFNVPAGTAGHVGTPSGTQVASLPKSFLDDLNHLLTKYKLGKEQLRSIV